MNLRSGYTRERRASERFYPSSVNMQPAPPPAAPAAGQSASSSSSEEEKEHISSKQKRQLAALVVSNKLAISNREIERRLGLSDKALRHHVGVLKKNKQTSVVALLAAGLDVDELYKTWAPKLGLHVEEVPRGVREMPKKKGCCLENANSRLWWLAEPARPQPAKWSTRLSISSSRGIWISASLRRVEHLRQFGREAGSRNCPRMWKGISR